MGVTHLEFPGYLKLFYIPFHLHYSIPCFPSHQCYFSASLFSSLTCAFSFGDHYEWSKVTSCIHNILSGQRWIEHYGEMSIKHTTTMGDVSHCKVTLLKVRSSRHLTFVFVPPTSPCEIKMSFIVISIVP